MPLSALLPSRARLRLALPALGLLLLASTADAKQLVYTALLSSAQETPPVASPANGNALLTYDTTTKMLCVAASYGGLTGAEILAHIHGPSAPGTPAGVLFALPLGNPKSACVGPLSNTDYSTLKKGLMYINIHTTTAPGGEIRGQILNVKGAKY